MSATTGDRLPGASFREVGVAGVRFALHRAQPRQPLAQAVQAVQALTQPVQPLTEPVRSLMRPWVKPLMQPVQSFVKPVADAAQEPAPRQPRRPEDPLRGQPPVLLLHGLPQTALMWRDLLPELARDRVVLAPDLKGLGHSEIRGPYDLGTLVSELAALVVHEVDRPVDVVGCDIGGLLALGLAAHRPDLVRRLVLCAVPYRPLDLMRAWHLLPAAFSAGRRIDLMIRAAWKSPEPLDPELLEHYRAAYSSRARTMAMLGYFRDGLRPELLARGHRMAVQAPGGGEWQRPERMLVVWGAKDPVLPPSVGAALAHELGTAATLLEVPGAGHFVVEEVPGTVVPAITGFLRQEVRAERAGNRL